MDTMGPRHALSSTPAAAPCATTALGKALSETVWQSHIYLNIQQTIPWKIILRANAGFLRRIRQPVHPLENNASSIWHSIGVQRNFLKEDRLSVSIFINNPFGRTPLDYTSRNIQHRLREPLHHYLQLPTRRRHLDTLPLRLTYRFGEENQSIHIGTTTSQEAKK